MNTPDTVVYKSSGVILADAEGHTNIHPTMVRYIHGWGPGLRDPSANERGANNQVTWLEPRAALFQTNIRLQVVFLFLFILLRAHIIRVCIILDPVFVY